MFHKTSDNLFAVEIRGVVLCVCRPEDWPQMRHCLGLLREEELESLKRRIDGSLSEPLVKGNSVIGTMGTKETGQKDDNTSCRLDDEIYHKSPRYGRNRKIKVGRARRLA
jgi:hypothetical protein